MKMKMKTAIMVCLVLFAASCSKEPYEEETATIPEAQNAVAVEQALLIIVNDHRISLGYNTLEYSSVAQEYADEHTDYMISKGNLSHDNFSSRASGVSAEVNAEFVAENVAKDYSDASSAFQGWLESSSHKKTMEGEFTHTAVSVKKASNGKLYFTQLFFR